jgi:hypothetical protein
MGGEANRRSAAVSVAARPGWRRPVSSSESLVFSSLPCDATHTRRSRDADPLDCLGGAWDGFELGSEHLRALALEPREPIPRRAAGRASPLAVKLTSL